MAMATSIAERIKIVRKLVPKRTQDAFAEALGCSRGAVANWEMGKGINTDNLFKISETFGVSLEWLRTGRGDMKDTGRKGNADLTKIDSDNHVSGGLLIRTASKMFADGTEPLPVFATHDNENGTIMIGDRVLARVERPSSLSGISDAYGVYVSTDEMSPLFRPGDIAWVNPALPHVNNCDVLLFRLDDKGRQIGMLRSLISYTAEEWTVEVLWPAREVSKLRRSLWTSCHRVDGKSSRR